MEASREITEKYEILEKVGEGAMGHVYKVRHRVLQRFDVIKMIHSRIFISDDAKKKFIKEAKVTADLKKHKNIVTVYDAGGEDETPYIAFELVKGLPLDKKIKGMGVVPIKQAMFYAKEIAEGLSHAHSMGFIHRDIKSENIILSDEMDEGFEIPKIADFGIAKTTEVEKPKEPKRQDWRLFGTPSYMSPEQASGEEATAASDQYSLGIVLFEMLTGQLPFKGIPLQVIMKHINEVPKTVTEINPEVPPQVSEIVSKMLEKDPANRFEDMDAVASKLQRSMGFVERWLKDHKENPGRRRFSSAGSGARGGGAPSFGSSTMTRIPTGGGVSSSAYSRQGAAIPAGGEPPPPDQLSKTLQMVSPQLAGAFDRVRPFALQLAIGGATGLLVFMLFVWRMMSGLSAEDMIPGDLTVTHGLKQVVVKWKSAGAYPSVIHLGAKEGAGRNYRGSEAAEKEHVVKVTDLEPGNEYHYRIEYPTGERSLPYTLVMPPSDFFFNLKLAPEGSSESVLSGNLSVPAKATLVVERNGKETEIAPDGSAEYDTAPTFKLNDWKAEDGDRLVKVVLKFETGESTEVEGSNIK